MQDSFDQDGHSRWLSRLLHIAVVGGLFALIGVRVYGYFATSRTDENAEARKNRSELRSDLAEEASEAYENERWQESAEGYRLIVERSPQNIQALYRYASSLHNNGDLEEAHAAWMQLCRFRQGRRYALYNIACIYALQGEKQLALDYLQEAIDAGFESRKPISEDQDLVSLLDDPEFRRLEELAKPIGMRDTYRRFDFLKGKWTLTNSANRRIGSLEVTTDNNGYTLVGRLINNASSVDSTMVCYFEPGAGRWKQVWVDDRGTVIQLASVDSEDNQLVLQGEKVTAEGDRQQARIVYAEDDAGVTSQTLFQSLNGEVWTPLLIFRLTSPGTKNKKTILGNSVQ
jgi:tetratricopeptide (TPR) repeat protein